MYMYFLTFNRLFSLLNFTASQICIIFVINENDKNCTIFFYKITACFISHSLSHRE